MRSKHLFVLRSSLVLLLSSGWGMALMGAGGSGSGGIAVIDTSQIATSSASIQKAISDVSIESKQAKADFEKKQAEIKAASEKYTRQQSVASKDENERRQKEISKLNDELEEIQFRLNRAVKKAQEKMVSPMEERIVSAVKEIAASRRISVVLAKEHTIYSDPAADLTKEVIARLDAK